MMDFASQIVITDYADYVTNISTLFLMGPKYTDRFSLPHRWLPPTLRIDQR